MKGLSLHEFLHRKSDLFNKCINIHVSAFSEPGKESFIAEILHARRMPGSSVSDQLPLDILHMDGIMFNTNLMSQHNYHHANVIHIPVSIIPTLARYTRVDASSSLTFSSKLFC